MRSNCGSCRRRTNDDGTYGTRTDRLLMSLILRYSLASDMMITLRGRIMLRSLLRVIGAAEPALATITTATTIY